MPTDIPLFESHLDGYTISTDPSRLDMLVIHRFLATEAYWRLGIPLPVLIDPDKYQS